MKNDRFKFRVWDNNFGEYIDEGALLNGSTGEIAGTGNYTIEQCTGIRDKNGKLIYEGDVVTIYNFLTKTHNKCVVGWEDLLLEYSCTGIEVEHIYWNMVASDSKYIKIIGNIHENGGAK